MTVEEYRRWLRRTIARDFGGNMSAAARDWGVDRGNLNNVIKGKLRPFPQLVEGSGFTWAIVKA